jgi:uncharacterized membrane protein YkvA (DUF1232 family)
MKQFSSKTFRQLGQVKKEKKLGKNLDMSGIWRKNRRTADREYLWYCEMKRNKPEHDKIIISEAV